MRPLIVAFLTLGATAAAADPNRFVYRVEADGCTSKPTTRLQTGFQVQGKQGIVTALHGVDGCTHIAAANEDESVVLSDLEPHDWDLARDVVLLRSVKHPLGFDGFEWTAEIPRHGLRVEVHGYPQGMPGIWGSGYEVARPSRRQLGTLIPPSLFRDLKGRGSPKLDSRVVSIAGDLQPGLSGAPVIDDRGRVFAVVNGGLGEGALGIGWAIPWADVELSAYVGSGPARFANYPFWFRVDPDEETKAEINELLRQLEGERSRRRNEVGPLVIRKLTLVLDPHHAGVQHYLGRLRKWIQELESLGADETNKLSGDDDFLAPDNFRAKFVSNDDPPQDIAYVLVGPDNDAYPRVDELRGVRLHLALAILKDVVNFDSALVDEVKHSSRYGLSAISGKPPSNFEQLTIYDVPLHVDLAQLSGSRFEGKPSLLVYFEKATGELALDIRGQEVASHFSLANGDSATVSDLIGKKAIVYAQPFDTLRPYAPSQGSIMGISWIVLGSHSGRYLAHGAPRCLRGDHLVCGFELTFPVFDR